ncbi:MAG TPA: hypothetical protein VMC08_05065 [Bacteroidales bacterium]|nr:hypothetical protein [Bacteroidales bacterium]
MNTRFSRITNAYEQHRILRWLGLGLLIRFIEWFHRLNKLRYKRNTKIREARQQLLEDKVDQAKSELEWIDAANKILEKKASHRSRILWPLAIALICLIVIPLCFYLRTPETEVSLDFYTGSIGFILKKSLKLPATALFSSIKVNSIGKLKDPDLKVDTAMQDPFDLTITDGSLAVSDVSFDSVRVLRIKILNGATQLITTQDSLKGTINFTKGTCSYLNQNFTISNARTDPPRTLTFYKAVSREFPLEITLTHSDSLALTDLSFDSLFMDGPVKRGSVMIVPIKKNMALLDGQKLSLNGIRMEHASIVSFNGLLHVRLDARVKRITGEFTEIRNDLRPSYLEYLYYNPTVYLLWIAAIFLSGLLWGLRDKLFK